MSTNLNEFCCSVVEEIHGELYARLYSHIAYHGRLSIPQLVQKSSLSPKQVKLACRCSCSTNLSITRQLQMAQVRTKSVQTTSYNLLRTGRLVELAKSKLGTIAASVVAEVAQLGFATIDELEERTLETLSYSRTDLTNGVLDGGLSRASLAKRVKDAIRLLLKDRFLQQVRPAHFQAHFDARQDAEMHLQNHGALPSAKGRKGQVELEMMNMATPGKRSLGEVDDQPVPKRQRVSEKRAVNVNGSTFATVVQDRTDSNVLVCASFQNLVSQIRNDLVVRKARKCLGLVPGRVMEAALSSLPSGEPENECTNEHQLNLEDLRDEVNLSPKHAMVNGHRHLDGDHANGVHDETDDILNEDDLSFGEIDHCLALLADSEFKFMHGKVREDQWKIDQKELNEYVQRQETLRMMGDRLGLTALRIVRMLIEKGKLDEKTLQELGLMGAKDLRQILAQLKQMGYIDLQEVPREAQRQPNRTIFLWFYDSRRVRNILLEGLYKAMSRLMQRLKFEKAKLSTTLEKIDRIDVQGQEESAMSEAELRVLKRWYRKEQWLLGELCRVDESVALLRDQ